MYAGIVERTARTAFEAVNRHDYDAFNSLCHPEVAHCFGGDHALGGTRRTLAGTDYRDMNGSLSLMSACAIKVTPSEPSTRRHQMNVFKTKQSDLSRRDLMIIGAGAVGAAFASSDAHAQATGALTDAGIARIAGAAQGPVDRGEVAGVVTLIATGGEVVVTAVGVQDLETRVPMQRDTIFRIASMTKPICALAALTLVEDGKLALDAAVDYWLPELSNRRVLRAIDSPLDDTVPAQRAITLRDLLTLRMGIGLVMEPPDTYPIQTAMADAGLQPGPEAFTGEPDEFMKRLGALPLIHQSGTRWMYHTGLDVLGVLIARASGMTLSAFLQTRIFAPLRMTDTAFFVPEAKMDRLATCYQSDPQTKALTVFDPARAGLFAQALAFEAGGGGLVSTVDDYLAFARMLLDKGQGGGQQLLSADTIAQMTTDQITPAQKAASPFAPGFWDTNGWGFGLSMTTAPDAISPTPGRLGWMGGFGTTFIADPREDLVAIILLQRLMASPDDVALNEAIMKETYRAVS